jgi:hypothetical protein
MRGRALTRSGRSRNDGWAFTSSAHSSREMRSTFSSPFLSTSHSASTLLAPGKRPAMPITAISVPLSLNDGVITPASLGVLELASSTVPGSRSLRGRAPPAGEYE